MEVEIEVQEVEWPLSLLAVKFLGQHEVLEVAMVRPNPYVMSSAFDEVSPFFKCANGGEHLFVVDFIVSFYCIEAFQEEGNWVPFVVFLQELW
jgi:hypothetical protein